MRFCTTCGSKLKAEESKFCTECGAPVGKSTESSKSISAEQGTRLVSPTPSRKAVPAHERLPKPSEGSVPKVDWRIVGAITIVVAGGGWWMLRGSKPSTPETSQPSLIAGSKPADASSTVTAQPPSPPQKQESVAAPSEPQKSAAETPVSSEAKKPIVTEASPAVKPGVAPVCNNLDPVHESVLKWARIAQARLLSTQEIGSIPADQRKLVRNGLYALANARFKTPALISFFSVYPWYHPAIDSEKVILPKVQIENATNIRDWEIKG